MAKHQPARRTIDSHYVKLINKTISPGDCVVLCPSYAARVERIEADIHGENVKIQVRRYYRPEEAIGGRKSYHGSKELFLSDHFDRQSADRIVGKFTVHTLNAYVRLDEVGNDDYFCRFEYKTCTGAFTPGAVDLYCNCEMPLNPDDLMVICEGCHNLFHPTCIDMELEEAEEVENYYCDFCYEDF